VRSDVDRLFAAYYPLQRSKDICFECGRLLMAVRDYSSAIDFFSRSNELCGEHHVTYHNMGICYFYQVRPGLVWAHLMPCTWPGLGRRERMPMGRGDALRRHSVYSLDRLASSCLVSSFP